MMMMMTIMMISANAWKAHLNVTYHFECIARCRWLPAAHAWWFSTSSAPSLSFSLSLCHFISPCLLSNFISSSVRQSTMKVLKLNEMKCCLDRFWPFSLPLFPSLCLSLRLSNLPQCLAQLASLPLSLNNLVSKYLLFALACFGQMTFDTLLWYYYWFLVALIYWKSQYLWLAKKSENIKGVTMALTAKWSPY